MSATFADSVLGEGPWLCEDTSTRRCNRVIPMPDGVELIADVHVPEGEGPWPAIVERTCYGAVGLAALGECYAAHGYLFVAVDVRGRFRSEGEWDPLAHEKSDGPAVLQWAARLPECNGQVGTRGHSYAGANQLLAAAGAGECLKAMVPSVAPADAFIEVPFQGGAYALGDLLWAWSQVGSVGVRSHSEDSTEESEEEDDSAEPSGEEEDQDDEATERLIRALTARPLLDVDLRLGARVSYLREWMRHWRRDDYWRRRSYLPDLEVLRIPSLHVTGWWDENGRGAALSFLAMGGAAGGQGLIIGPWNHSLGVPNLEDLPPYEAALIRRAALRDAFADELAWFERHLKGHGRPLPPVEVFITGAWQWLELPDWPPPGVECVSWHFAPKEALTLTPPRRTGSRSYRFDPGRPNLVNVWDVPAELGPYDTAPDVDKTVLAYRSAPIEEALLAMGPVRVRLSAATTARDVDWIARLVDEYPEGGPAIWIRDGILRARFRDGFEDPQPVVPGTVSDYEIDLGHVGHRFRAGHRVRVEIASSAVGRWDVNPGDGEDLATSTAAVASKQTVYHGPKGSCLLLTVAPMELTQELLGCS